MDSHEPAGKVVHQEVIEGVHRFPPGGSRFHEPSSSFLLASFLFADHPLSPPTHIQGESLGMPFSLHCKPAPGRSLCLPSLQGLLPLSVGGSLTGATVPAETQNEKGWQIIVEGASSEMVSEGILSGMGSS